jgi:hypothetical protein
VLLLPILLVLSLACQSNSQKTREEEEVRNAKEQLALGAEAYNLTQCFEHLHVTQLTADESPKWRRFKKQHHIDSTPSAMSDADLKDCLKMQ